MHDITTTKHELHLHIYDTTTIFSKMHSTDIFLPENFNTDTTQQQGIKISPIITKTNLNIELHVQQCIFDAFSIFQFRRG